VGEVLGAGEIFMGVNAVIYKWCRMLKRFAVICAVMCLLYPVSAYGERGWEPPGHNPSRISDVHDVRTWSRDGEQGSTPDDIVDGTPGLNMALTPLKRYFLPSFGIGGDHMTSIKGFPEVSPGSAEDHGNLYYVSTHSQPDTLPLYRLLSKEPLWDHMAANEESAAGGYVWEGGLLGYPFASAGEGMTPIMRWVNPSPTDHLVAFHGETPPGYVEDGLLGYGYPRFGVDDGPANPHSVYLHLTHNGVTLKCDLVWGGMIYELRWNGQQFVDHNDCGRGIQTALFKPGLTDLEFGPTEAGDNRYHGSPVAESYVEGNTLYTRSLPLQWHPAAYLDPEDPYKEHRPVLYGGEFEREAKFLSVPGHRIIQYKVGYRPAESDDFMPEWVTAYLNLDVTERFWTVTPEGDLEEVHMPSSGNWADRSVSKGAVAASTGDSSHALGLLTTSGARLLWWNFDRADTRKLAIWEPRKYMEAGTWYHRTFYLLVGTLEEVHESAVFLLNRGKNLSPIYYLLGLYSDAGDAP
jgi:hypothetical protein